jgi:hypothetical protein
MAVSDNWQKAAPSTTFGTPALDFYVIDMGTEIEGEGDWELSNSLYAKAIRGIQQVANIYMVGRPNSQNFVVAVVSNTCPGRNPGAIDGTNSYLQDAINAAAGVECYAYYAAFNGSSFNWND